MIAASFSTSSTGDSSIPLVPSLHTLFIPIRTRPSSSLSILPTARAEPSGEAGAVEGEEAGLVGGGWVGLWAAGEEQTERPQAVGGAHSARAEEQDGRRIHTR